MNAADALMFGLLAVADLSLIVHLRRGRTRRARAQRMWRSLQFAIQRGTASQELAHSGRGGASAPGSFGGARRARSAPEGFASATSRRSFGRTV